MVCVARSCRAEKFGNVGHDSGRRDTKYRPIMRCLMLVVVSVVFSSCEQFESCKSNFEAAVKKDLENRWERENELFRSGLKIRDDDGKLVELTTEDRPPLESTRRSSSHAIYFNLYTRGNPTEPHQISMDQRWAIRKLKMSYYNFKRQTFFVTHGWASKGESLSCTMIRNELLKNRLVNVIVVDWSSMSSWSYTWAVTHVGHVSAELTRMIEFLVKHAHLDLDKITLVGHSLGAHIMGIAGHAMNGTIGTIIGLDPAYPSYHLATAGSRIADTDAKHVQIIHTNAGFLGYEEPIGTSDFYVDGGSDQLGCRFDPGGSCSHARAYMYYAESINTRTGFFGRTCESANDFVLGNCTTPNSARMGGFRVDRRLHETYYLWTNGAAPFAKGIRG